MFDRFTRRAVKVLFHARAEASQFGSSAIEPEHLLLGILDEGGGLGGRILARTGHALDDVRQDIVRRLTRGEKVPESNEIPLSPSCQRALQYAAEDADRMAHDYIGTEHLLVGLLREERSVAADVLTVPGLRVETVRQAIIELVRRGDEPEPPGPPSTPANTYQWPQIPFVPSETVHILQSGMRWPEQPVINHPGSVFSAYGFSLVDIIVRAWDGSRWHVDIAPELRDEARFDFLMVLRERQPTAACLARLRVAIERQFGVQVTREMQMRDVYRLSNTKTRGSMLRRYPDPEGGIVGFSWMPFAVFIRRPRHAPIFPLDGFSVHSVPLAFLVRWFEDILGGQVIDDTGLPGIYGFELKGRVATPEAFIQLLRDEAGLLITQERREIPTLIVR